MLNLSEVLDHQGNNNLVVGLAAVFTGHSYELIKKCPTAKQGEVVNIALALLLVVTMAFLTMFWAVDSWVSTDPKISVTIASIWALIIYVTDKSIIQSNYARQSLTMRFMSISFRVGLTAIVCTIITCTLIAILAKDRLEAQTQKIKIAEIAKIEKDAIKTFEVNSIKQEIALAETKLNEFRNKSSEIPSTVMQNKSRFDDCQAEVAALRDSLAQSIDYPVRRSLRLQIRTKKSYCAQLNQEYWTEKSRYINNIDRSIAEAQGNLTSLKQRQVKSNQKADDFILNSTHIYEHSFSTGNVIATLEALFDLINKDPTIKKIVVWFEIMFGIIEFSIVIMVKMNRQYSIDDDPYYIALNNESDIFKTSKQAELQVAREFLPVYMQTMTENDFKLEKQRMPLKSFKDNLTALVDNYLAILKTVAKANFDKETLDLINHKLNSLAKDFITNKEPVNTDHESINN